MSERNECISWLLFLLFFIPFGFILVVVFAVFVIEWIFSLSSQSLHNDGPRVIVGGIVARDAGLLGMTSEERRMVIEHILKPGVSLSLYTLIEIGHTLILPC